MLIPWVPDLNIEFCHARCNLFARRRNTVERERRAFVFGSEVSSNDEV
jgi:hypothetical protein